MILSKYKMIEYYFKVFRTIYVSDKVYREHKFKRIFGKDISIDCPSTLNEKINYRMVFQHLDFFTLIADKLAVRDYIKLTIGNDYLVPLIGIYNNPEEIDFDLLPKSFVMKCNHDSGSTIIVLNKDTVDKKSVMRHFKQHLKRNPYYTNREWQYKNIKPRIMIEVRVDIFNSKDKNNTAEMFRIHCFHGKPHFIEADFTTDSGKEYVNIYNVDWEIQPFTLGFSNTPFLVDKPDSLAHMLEVAGKIAVDFDYCRIDLMATKDKVYFSEITLTPESGQLKFNPPEWDEKLGKLWIL